MASSEGGMDIEEVAHATPEKILKVFVDPATGLTDAQGAELAKKGPIGRIAQNLAGPAVRHENLIKRVQSTCTATE